jgi:hypothetical protein
MILKTAHTLVNTLVHVSSELEKEQSCNNLRALEDVNINAEFIGYFNCILIHGKTRKEFIKLTKN